MDSWAEGARRYKRERAEDPPESRRQGTRKLAEKTASRKVLLDRLDSARKTLMWYVDLKAEGRGGWWVSGFELARKRYVEALENCWKAGIDVKA